MPGFKYHVFLSHSTPEKPAVEKLAVRLRREGIEPWLDKWNLVPGELCQVVMETALTDCATCAVFIGPSGFGVWQEEEMRAAIARRVNEARTVPNAKDRFRVIPVLLPNSERPERGLLPPFLAAATWVEFRKSLDDQDAFHRLVCGIRGVEPGAGLSGAAFEGACPYRGLEVFNVEHAPFFFGREALTEWLIVKLRASPSGQENRFLAILGASGSGKSSLARAGLIPAIKRGELVGSAEWPVVIFKPGRDPIESLAVALAGLDGATRPSPVAVQGLMSGLQATENTLHLTTRLALRDAPSAPAGPAGGPVRGGLHALRGREDPQGPVHQPALCRHHHRRADDRPADDAGRFLRQVRTVLRAGRGDVGPPAPGRSDDRG